MDLDRFGSVCLCVRVRRMAFVIAAEAQGQAGSVGGDCFLAELPRRRLGQNDTLCAYLRSNYNWVNTDTKVR